MSTGNRCFIVNFNLLEFSPTNALTKIHDKTSIGIVHLKLGHKQNYYIEFFNEMLYRFFSSLDHNTPILLTTLF